MLFVRTLNVTSTNEIFVRTCLERRESGSGVSSAPPGGPRGRRVNVIAPVAKRVCCGSKTIFLVIYT